MTQNQIAYLRLQEEQRSNLAQEAEQHRANAAREAETMRSNLRAEELKVSDQAISSTGNMIASDRNAIAEREVAVKEQKLPSEIALTEEKTQTEDVSQAHKRVDIGTKIVDSLLDIGQAVGNRAKAGVSMFTDLIDAIIPG